MREVTSSEEGEEISLAIFMGMRGGTPSPHVLPLHGLGLGPVIFREDSNPPLYAWALGTSAGQVHISIQVDPAWLLPSEDRVMVNKVAAVDASLQNEEPSDLRVVLNRALPGRRYG